MNKNKILLVAGIVVAIGIGVILLLSAPDPHRYDKGSHPARLGSSQTQSPTPVVLDTKIDSQGVVTVEVTPLTLSSNDSNWTFDVGLNTHSEELNQDMMKAAVLVDDVGNEYKPISWDGSVPGGHHRRGTLTFSKVTPVPKTIELKISNVDVPVRTFVWNIIN
jgi:hypothetical protein